MTALSVLLGIFQVVKNKILTVPVLITDSLVQKLRSKGTFSLVSSDILWFVYAAFFPFH